MRRLLKMALLLAALFLAIKLLGATGVFAFAAAYALFLLAKSFLRTKTKPGAGPSDVGSSRLIQSTEEKLYSERLTVSKNLAIALFLFFVLVFFAFALISGGLEWLGMPRIGRVENITSQPGLNFGEVIYPCPSLQVTEDLKYQVFYVNPSDRPLNNVVITVTISLKPHGLAVLLPEAKSPVTRTMTLGAFPPYAVGLLNIPVDPPLLKTSGTPWRFLLFLIDSVWLQLFWSTILAVLTAVVIAAAILLPVGYFGSRVMYGEYDEYKEHEWEAIYSAISIVLGINKGTWLVREGKAQVLHLPAGGLARFGGPGVLIVQEGHAVILEKSGRLSRVVGRGLTWLKPLERISMVVDLTAKTQPLEVEDVITQDGVIIKKFQAWVFYRVIPGDRDKPGYKENGRYPFNEDVVLQLWDTEGGLTWQSGVKAITQTALRDVVARHPLDEIYANADQFRIMMKGDKQQPKETSQFQGELRAQINQIIVPFLGVEAIAADIGRIEIPAEAEKKLLEKWSAGWDVKVAEGEKAAKITRLVTEAVGKRDVALLEAETVVAGAKAEAEALVIKGRGEAEATVVKGEGVAQAERRALVTKAEGKKDATKIEAEAMRETATIRAGSKVEEARAEAEAAMIKGRGEAEAKAELFRRMLTLGPLMDPKTLQSILRRLQSGEEMRTMANLLFGAGEWRYPGGTGRLPTSPYTGEVPKEEAEEEPKE